MRMRGLVVLLPFLALLAACQTTSGPSAADLAYQAFELSVNRGEVDAKRGENNTFVYEKRVTEGNLQFDCRIVRAADDGSTGQKAAGYVAGLAAKFSENGCSRVLE